MRKEFSNSHLPFLKEKINYSGVIIELVNSLLKEYIIIYSIGEPEISLMVSVGKHGRS